MCVLESSTLLSPLPLSLSGVLTKHDGRRCGSDHPTAPKVYMEILYYLAR